MRGIVIRAFLLTSTNVCEFILAEGLAQQLESKIQLTHLGDQLLKVALVLSVALTIWFLVFVILCWHFFIVVVFWLVFFGVFCFCLFNFTMSSQKEFIQVIPDIKFSSQMIVEWGPFWDSQHAPENLSSLIVYEISGIFFS